MWRATLLLIVICIPISAQDPVRTLQRQVSDLQKQLQARDAREKALTDRVSSLEGQLADERRTNAAKVQELQDEAFGDRLEREIAGLTERVAEVERTPAAGSALSWSGYFDFEYRHDQAKRNPTFDQHRLILKADATILEDAITFRSEIEIEGGGADASFLSGNEIVVEFAELHFHVCRAFNVKAGILLVPFGRFNTLHDSPLRDLTDRPLVARRIIPTTWADSGVGIYGAFDIADVLIEYDIMVGNGLDDDFSSTPGGGFRGNRNSYRADNNDSKMVIGRVGVIPALSFLDTLELGFSFGIGQYDDFDDQQLTMFGFDWNVRWGPFELIGEWACLDLERDQALVDAGAPGGADGFYVQLNFHFFPEAWRGAAKFFTDESTFTLVFRFGSIDTDTSALGIDRVARGDAFRDDLYRYTVGLNFRPIEKTVIKIEYQFFDEYDGIPDARNNRFVVSVATFF